MGNGQQATAPAFDPNAAYSPAQTSTAPAFDPNGSYQPANPPATQAQTSTETAGQGFWGAAWNDLKNLIRYPSAQNPYPGMGVEAKQAAAQQSAEQNKSEQAAGYSQPYRVLAPVAQSLGVNVPGMEQAAKQGDAGAVMGHAVAAATPAVVGLAAGELAQNSGKLSDLLQNSAQRNYETVLNPTKISTKYQTQKIMPQLLEERPTALTRQGLADQAATKAEAAGQQVEEAVSNLKGTMSVQPVLDSLEKLKQQNTVNGVDLRPEVTNAIEQVQGQFQAMGPDISLQDGVKARRILDSAVAEAKGYQGAQLSDASMAAIRKEGANSIRTELAQASPDLAAVNAKFHFWNTLNDVVEQTIQRKTGQAKTGLLPTIETGAAGAAGLAKGGLASGAGYAGAMYTLGKMIRSTGWQTVSAATKLKIADTLMTGRFDAINGLLIGSGLSAVNSPPSQPVNNAEVDEK